MPLFGQNNPYMTRPHGLGNPNANYTRNASYQIVPGPSGLPMAQVEVQFRRDLPPVTNPEMSLTLIIDRSGSMNETFQEGHVDNLVTTLYNYITANGQLPGGFNMAFYDQYTTHAGFVGSLPEARNAIYGNFPRGLGTYAAEALASSVQRYQDHRGMYIIVITDGEFADKMQVQNYIVQQLLPKLTPENPYAFRLHFIGAGHEVDREFLEQLERAASGQGAPLVTQHHHAHLSHSHNTILDEMDKAYVGVSRDAAFGSLGALAGLADSAQITEPDNLVSRCVDSSTRRSWHGSSARIGFLPRHAVLGCELAAHHPNGDLPLAIRYMDINARQVQFTIPVPMPKSTAVAAPPPASPLPPSSFSTAATPPAPQTGGTSLFGIKLPWLHVSGSPEEQAHREQEARERQELQQRVQQNLIAEQQRQSQDLRELARGGIPIQAVERLKEIGDQEGGIFTSDLTPEESGLLRREGYRALGMVTGSAMYHVGQAYASATGDCEVTVLSDAYNAATQLAVDRMRQELAHIGGHGVVGVRLSLVRHEWADKTIEVQVIGTAVEGPGAPPKDPWLCDLSGQEWYALHRAGYAPAGLVWGHATWFILTTQADEWNVRSWSNVEMSHWSNALSKARHIALNKVKAQATRHGATGVAGVAVERRLDEVRLTGGEGDVYEREHHNLVVSILGTAIRPVPNAPTSVRPTVQMLSLRDGRLSPIAIKEKDVAVE